MRAKLTFAPSNRTFDSNFSKEQLMSPSGYRRKTPNARICDRCWRRSRPRRPPLTQLYAGLALIPLMTRPSLPADTLAVPPSPILPSRISPARRLCRARRLQGWPGRIPTERKERSARGAGLNRGPARALGGSAPGFSKPRLRRGLLNHRSCSRRRSRSGHRPR